MPVSVTQAQKRGLGAVFWLLVALGLADAVKVNGGAGGGGGAPPTVPPGPGPGPVAPSPPVPPVTPPGLPPGIPSGSTFDPASNSWTDPSGNIWSQNADGSWSLSPIPSGSTFNPVTNTWTDPSGNTWSQNADGTWSEGVPPILRPHVFPIGSRVNLTIPEGIFPATVTRHEGNSTSGEPLYGLTLDIGVNATAIPESLLSAGAPLPVPPPLPTGEYRNLTFAFSATETLSNVDGRVRLTVSGEHRGPATSIQARMGASDPVFQGVEAVSIETFLPDTSDFFPFGPIATGNLEWPAFTLEGGDSFQLLGRLVETDGMGTVLSAAGSQSQQLVITSSLACQLDNNRAEILVQDDTGTHPLVQVGQQDQAEISTRSTPFVLTWPVRNQGTGPQSVRLEVLCRRTIFLGGRFPRFSILETIVGPSFLVASGQQVLLSMTVSLADFPKCDTAGDYILQMVGSDPACGQIGGRVIFKVVFSAAAPVLAGFP